jgi:hypothetical protein
MSTRLTQILARLERTVDTVVQAMKPYKPKTPAQLRLKTDPAHRLMRDAYKRRTSTDKAKDHKYDKTYYQRNKSQIKQRQKRSSQIHKHPTAN